AESAQAKSKINSRVVLGSERPRGRLFIVGGNWMQRREYRTVKDDSQAIEAVTDDDLRAVLAKYPLSVSTTLAIGPLEMWGAPGYPRAPPSGPFPPRRAGTPRLAAPDFEKQVGLSSAGKSSTIRPETLIFGSLAWNVR